MRCRAGDAGLVVQKVSALGPRLIPVDLGDHVYSRCISVMQPGLGQKGQSLIHFSGFSPSSCLWLTHQRACRDILFVESVDAQAPRLGSHK